MTADDPRPAGEAAAKACSCNPLSHERGDRCSCYCHQPRPAASGGATDGEREEWRWHREPGTGDEWEQVWTCCGGPYDERPHGHYADCPAPVASQAEEGLREGLREELLAEFRMRFSPRIGMSERAVERLADAVVGLPAVRRLLAGAAKVQRVEKLARQYKRFGEELHDVPRAESFADVALDLRRALGDQP